MKTLLDTNAKNTKIAKTLNKANGKIRMASLSMMPTAILCPSSKAAGCFDTCLKYVGKYARTDNVVNARQRKTDWYMNDREGFLAKLRQELRRFSNLCAKQDVQGVVRLNVLSDISWEDHGIPQEFPELEFYDYSKRGLRIKRLEAAHKRGELLNYRLMFSYSGREQFNTQVNLALSTDVPVAVVFKGPMPPEFFGRPVVDGDASDWDNVNAGRVVVGLKAKGSATTDTTGFVVDTTKLIAVGA